MTLQEKLQLRKLRLEANALVDREQLKVRLLSASWQRMPTKDWDFRLKALELFSAEGQTQRGLFNLATLNLQGVKK